MSLGAGDPDWHALGSPYFASHLERFYPTGKPGGAIIFDMVCYRSMQLTPEKGSLHYAPDAIAKFWTIGRSRAPSYFALGSTRLKSETIRSRSPKRISQAFSSSGLRTIPGSTPHRIRSINAPQTH